jgi:hypothetical protein
MLKPHNRTLVASTAKTGAILLVFLSALASPNLAACGEDGDCRGGWLNELDYSVVGRTGGSYFDVPGESLWGGTYGADLLVGLTDSWAAVGSANANHITGGTQFAGTVGLIRANDLECCDPWSISIAWDQFTESRVAGMYLSQLRLQAGYSPNECTEFGAVYTNPTNRDNDVPYTFTFLGNNFSEFGTVNLSESISAYAAREFGNGIQYNLVAGYREDPDTMLFSGSVKAPVNDQLAIYTGGSYGERFGTWGIGFGLEWRFGSGAGRGNGGYTRDDQLSRSDEPSEVSLVSYVPPAGDFPNPPVGAELLFDALRDIASPQTIGQERLTQRIVKSHHKHVWDTFNQPARLWGSCSGDPDRNPFFRDLGAVNTFNVRYGQPGKTDALFLGEAQ